MIEIMFTTIWIGINMKIIFADSVSLAARDGVSLPLHVLMFISYFDIILLYEHPCKEAFPS